MWVLKGSLLGIVIFIGTVLLYGFARLGYAVYTTAKIAHVTPSGVGVGYSFDLRGLTASPEFWVTLVLAVSLGLYLAKRYL